MRKGGVMGGGGVTHVGGAKGSGAGPEIKGRGYTEMGGAKASLIRHPNEKGRGYESGAK